MEFESNIIPLPFWSKIKFKNYVSRKTNICVVNGFTIEGVFIYIYDSISGYMTALFFSLKSCLTKFNTKIASGVVRTMIDGRWGGV